jgi:hypothetical protein
VIPVLTLAVMALLPRSTIQRSSLKIRSVNQTSSGQARSSAKGMPGRRIDSIPNVRLVRCARPAAQGDPEIHHERATARRIFSVWYMVAGADGHHVLVAFAAFLAKTSASPIGCLPPSREKV